MNSNHIMHCIRLSVVPLFFLLSTISTKTVIKIIPLYDIKLNSQINLRRSNVSDVLVYEGIFSKFIYDLLYVLISDDFPDKRLKKFLKTLNRNLREMPYKYAKRLGKYCLELVKDETEKEELSDLRADLNKDMPMRREFLNELNEVYTLVQGVRFSDFVFDVKDYGTRDKLFIEEETRKVLFDHILNPILKLSGRRLLSLERKLKKAVKEYENDMSEDQYKDIYKMIQDHHDNKGNTFMQIRKYFGV